METMQLVHTTHTTDLTTWMDADVEAFFTQEGLAVKVVEHCNDATCPECFAAAAPARAA